MIIAIEGKREKGESEGGGGREGEGVKTRR